MGDDLDVNLILYKLNKYQTKLANGEGNLDIYRQKIHFYSEQLGGGKCNKIWWSENQKKSLDEQIISELNIYNKMKNKDINVNVLIQILKNLENSKLYNHKCKLWLQFLNRQVQNIDINTLLLETKKILPKS